MRRLGRNLRLRQITDFINWLYRPDFFAPLTHNLLLTRGYGVATFTRATTATVTDFEGLLKTAKASEPRFEGARRVENLINSSENFNFVAQGSTPPTITQNVVYDGKPRCVKIDFASGVASSADARADNAIGASIVVGQKGSGRFLIAFSRPLTGSESIKVYEDNTNSWSATFSAANSPTTSLSLRGGTGTAVASAPMYCGIHPIAALTSPLSVYITEIHIEKVDGQANSVCGNYLSKGVISAPYNGANVDGVAYYDTLNGNTISGTAITEATGSVIPEATLKGVVVEVASTNLFLQSKTLVTQSVTTTAITYTVSFTGTGTIVLSGTYTGTLVGTGTNNRVSLSFTATAGMLIATVTGSCTLGQCEALPMATSYIPTTTSTVTRNADVLTFPNAGNVSDTAGTVLMDVTPAFDIPAGTTTGYGYNFLIDFGLGEGRIISYNNNLSRMDGTNNLFSPTWLALKNITYKTGSRWGSIGQRNWVNGTAGTNSAFDGSINSGPNSTIGGYGGGTAYNWGGTIKNLKIYKKALSDAQIQQQIIQA